MTPVTEPIKDFPSIHRSIFEQMDVDMTDQPGMEEAFEGFPEELIEDLDDFVPMAFLAALKGALARQPESNPKPISTHW